MVSQLRACSASEGFAAESTLMQHASAHRLSPVHISSRNLTGVDEAHCHRQTYTFHFRGFESGSPSNFHSTQHSFVCGNLKESKPNIFPISQLGSSIQWVNNPRRTCRWVCWNFLTVFCHWPTNRVGSKKYGWKITLSVQKCPHFLFCSGSVFLRGGVGVRGLSPACRNCCLVSSQADFLFFFYKQIIWLIGNCFLLKLSKLDEPDMKSWNLSCTSCNSLVRAEPRVSFSGGSGAWSGDGMCCSAKVIMATGSHVTEKGRCSCNPPLGHITGFLPLVGCADEVRCHPLATANEMNEQKYICFCSSEFECSRTALPG